MTALADELEEPRCAPAGGRLDALQPEIDGLRRAAGAEAAGRDSDLTWQSFAMSLPRRALRRQSD